jgi:dihydrolipoamide dehydrogenase
MATHLKTHAVVIGAGPGGYVAAIRLAQRGIETVCVDEKFLGGVCLNVGCIPSKALITASKRYEQALKHNAEMGVNVSGVSVDMTQMQRWKSSVVNKLTSGVGSLFKGNGVKNVVGRARVSSANRVTVNGPDGETIIDAKAIVLATGSRPIEIPGFEVDQKTVVDSTGALDLDHVPKRLVVIGGGYIGLELGSTFGRLGSHVTVVELAEQLLPGFPKDLVRPVQRKMAAHGAEFLLGHKALGWSANADGSVNVTVQDASGKPATVTADKILLTVGRRPNYEGLGLEELGVAMERGFVTVDKQMRTNVPGIYAIGDLVGNPMLAHKASAEAGVVADVIAGKNTVFDARCIPAVVFTDPEVATVGLSEAQAKSEGFTVKTGKYPFAGLGRALTTGETDGFVRVIADGDSTEVLGVEIVGPEASDLIAEAGLGIEMGALVDDFGLTIHAHPTLAEAVMEAAEAALGHSVHMVNRRR